MTTPKHIGIVACSAEGAALCYRTICSAGSKILGGHRHPEVSMHTHSFEDYLICLRREDWYGISALMIESGNKLAVAGADFLICPDNTIHQALPAVISKSTLPWLHIADVVADEAVRYGFNCLGILGTRWLVEGNVYTETLEERGLGYLRPTSTECAEVNRIILDELVYGVFKEQSTAYVSDVIVRMKDAGCDAVVLGCTELPLIITSANAVIPPLDSTRLLAQDALQRAIGEDFLNAHAIEKP